MTFQDGIAFLDFAFRVLSGMRLFLRELGFRFRKISFYIDDYKKTVTVFKNGNGIITNTFRIKVLDWQKFTEQGLERFFDIRESSKKSTKMPPLLKMIASEKSGRFSTYGFWYKSTADIFRLYRILDDDVDYKRWKFKIDPTKIEIIKKNIVYLSYAVSIPGLFPVKDGWLDTDESRCECPFVSALSVKNQINRITYSVSFEKDVRINNNIVEASVFIPLLNEQKEVRKQTLVCREDLFYYRFFFTKRFPKYQSEFELKWNVLKAGDTMKDADKCLL